jgi:hypothetical protein
MSSIKYFSILPFIWEIGKITSSSICDVIIFIKSATIPVIVMITLEDITSTSAEIITKLSRKIYHVNCISHSQLSSQHSHILNGKDVTRIVSGDMSLTGVTAIEK